ncbi:ferrochelatase [Thalassotalea profundi]|uniref:Ferrochelatase n=1 Tax=Thalassotalea profundi TaxID=2036687 RepID=A0ABQ3IYM5_9GAMM|nr:ferrochelatase [Thalassotalea profundi]GHE95235.1 ferrochelatase 2 [Thalassotalea profundi]
MSRYLGRNKSVHKSNVKTAILLTNLGTPVAPTASALRTYLKEFLSDPRVVEIPRLVWLIILHGIILRIRPKKSAKLYQSIWTEQGSPLMVISQALMAKVSRLIAEKYQERVIVDLAMRYGEPSIESALNHFQKQGVQNIIVLPLYPQYAGPTTGSTFDAVVKVIQRWRWIPSLHFVSSYHDHPMYIKALANSVNEHVAKFGKPDKFVLSYHGMPKLFLDSGDPYYCFCHKTTRLLMTELEWQEDDYVMSFQSRFGKAEWLKPYTDETLVRLAQQGDKHIAIISPAFSADCLETLEELAHENKETFLNAGGEKYYYIDALNDRDDHSQMVLDIVEKYIGGNEN